MIFFNCLTKNRFKVFVLLTFLGVVTPGAVDLGFSGFPLSSRRDLMALLIISSCLFSTQTDHTFSNLTSRIKSFGILIIFTLLALAVPAKFLTKFIDPDHIHFNSCYHSLLEGGDEMQVPDCEPFFSAKFEGGRSRLDETINFHGMSFPMIDSYPLGSNWNLSFMNNEQFSGRSGKYDHLRHPFSAEWVGQVKSNFANGYIPSTYVGSGAVEIDGQITDLPTHYGFPSTVWIPVRKGEHRITISYIFASVQLKPVNGVSEQPNGYYATLKVGNIQKVSKSEPDSIIGWAVDPIQFKKFDKIIYLDDKNQKKISSETSARVDVLNYLGFPENDPQVGFAFTNLRPTLNSSIYGLTDKGDLFEMLRWENSNWTESPKISRGKQWFNVDYSFQSGNDFGVLKTAGARPAIELIKKLINFIFVIALLFLVLVLVAAYAKFWTSYFLLGIGLLIHGIFFDWTPGWGTDGVEGSAEFYTSALVMAIALLYAIRYKPNSFASVGFLGAIYVSLNRITSINPGMRNDHFQPLTDSSLATSLASVFFRPTATDWIIHAANTRSSLFRGFLFGNESVFYLQPGYRYLAPMFHYLFGDGDVRLSLVVMFLTILSLFLLIDIAIKSASSKTSKILLAFLTIGVLQYASSWVTAYFMLVQTTEIPTWPFFLFGSYFVLRFRNSGTGIVIPSIFFGLAVCTRPNQIIGHTFFLLAISLFVGIGIEKRLRIKYLITRFALMGAVSSLPLIHNLYYGKTFVVFSTSRAGSSFEFSTIGDHILRYIYIFARPLRTEDLTKVMGLPNAGYSKVLLISIALFFVTWITVSILIFKDKFIIEKMLSQLLRFLIYSRQFLTIHISLDMQ